MMGSRSRLDGEPPRPAAGIKQWRCRNRPPTREVRRAGLTLGSAEQWEIEPLTGWQRAWHWRSAATFQFEEMCL